MWSFRQDESPCLWKTKPLSPAYWISFSYQSCVFPLGRICPLVHTKMSSLDKTIRLWDWVIKFSVNSKRMSNYFYLVCSHYLCKVPKNLEERLQVSVMNWTWKKEKQIHDENVSAVVTGFKQLRYWEKTVYIFPPESSGTNCRRPH